MAAERHLFYVTGGVALIDFGASKALDFPAAPVGFRYETNLTGAKAGWVVGGGWEFALTGNWSTKVEYLHLEADRTAFTTTINAAAIALGAGFTHTYRLREDVIRVGLNYRFGGPVVAR